MKNEDDVLKDVGELWAAASTIHRLVENRWAKNKRLVNSKHLSQRRAGQSSLFIPKIESFHQRKQADYIAALASDDPISLKPTLNATAEGAKIMETLCNHYISDAGGIRWKQSVMNSAHNALTYNYAPWAIDWDRYAEEIETDEGIVEQEVYSHPTLEILPPEDLRVDPAIGWDEIGQARFGIIRRWRDKAYAKRMAQEGTWPKLDDSLFQASANRDFNVLENERSLFGASQISLAEIDNGLIEVWETYYYDEDEDGDYSPMKVVSIQDTKLLEEPIELEFDLSGQDGSDPWPFGIGRLYIEPHEVISRAMPEKLEQLQIETNAIRNQRRDNVALILNREKFMTSDAGIDPAVLSRSYAGKVTVVKSQGSVWWDTPPDVTASSYNEESKSVQDMEGLVAESNQRLGKENAHKQTATEQKLTASNSATATGLDVAIFTMTFAEPLVKKLIRMIKQAASVDMYEKAAVAAAVEVEDPYMEAIKGAYKTVIGAGAHQAAKDTSISNASNMAAILQSVYGPQANYYPIMAPMLEDNGLNPEEIIPNPKQQQQPQSPHPSQMDAGGIQEGAAPLTPQPNVALTGGAFGSQQ